MPVPLTSRFAFLFLVHACFSPPSVIQVFVDTVFPPLLAFLSAASFPAIPMWALIHCHETMATTLHITRLTINVLD